MINFGAVGDPEVDGRHAALTSALAEARNDLRSLKVSVTDLESRLSDQASQVETLDKRANSIDWKSYTQELESATEEVRLWRETIEEERKGFVSSLKEEVFMKFDPLLQRLSPLEESVEERSKQLRPLEERVQSIDGRVEELQAVVQKLLDANKILDTLAARDERIKAEGTFADSSHNERINRLELMCANLSLTGTVKNPQESTSLAAIDQRLDDLEKVTQNLSSAFKDASLLTWGQEFSNFKQCIFDHGAEMRECREELSQEIQTRTLQVENLSNQFQLANSNRQAQHSQFDGQHIPEPDAVQKCLDAFANLESQLKWTSNNWKAQYDTLLEEFEQLRSLQIADESARKVVMDTGRWNERAALDDLMNLVSTLENNLMQTSMSHGATVSRVAAVEIHYTELEKTLKDELQREADHRIQLFKALSERVNTLSTDDSKERDMIQSMQRLEASLAAGTRARSPEISPISGARRMVSVPTDGDQSVVYTPLPLRGSSMEVPPSFPRSTSPVITVAGVSPPYPVRTFKDAFKSSKSSARTGAELKSPVLPGTDVVNRLRIGSPGSRYRHMNIGLPG